MMTISPVEEPAGAGVIMTQEEQFLESQSQQRPRDCNRSLGGGLQTDRSLQGSALVNQPTQEAEAAYQPGQPEAPRRSSRNIQAIQDARAGTNVEDGDVGQITVTPFSNDDLDANELSEGGTSRLQRARTVMIKQPSSGETASQFHDNDSPRAAKLSQPPRDSAHSINHGVNPEHNGNIMSPPQQYHQGQSQI